MAEVFLVPRSEGEPFCLSPPSRPMHLEGEEVTGRVYFVELRAPFVVHTHQHTHCRQGAHGRLLRINLGGKGGREEGRWEGGRKGCRIIISHKMSTRKKTSAVLSSPALFRVSRCLSSPLSTCAMSAMRLARTCTGMSYPYLNRNSCASCRKRVTWARLSVVIPVITAPNLSVI